MSAHQQLRSATAPDHEAVDGAFARFDLGDRAGYGAFLVAHARAVPAIEAVLDGTEGPLPLRARTPLLFADLAALGLAIPALLTVDAPVSQAEAWGIAYVLEGSRLGGGLLARSVPADLPQTYLRETHLPGEWRAFTTALDTALTSDDEIAQAIRAARRIFAVYGAAVATG